MKSKSMILLVMALGCGLVAMVGVQQVLKGNNAPVKMVSVLVATAPVEPYTRLDDTKVAFREFGETAVPEGAVLLAADYEGRALMSGAIPGEVILKGKLTEKGKFGASGIIPKGMRVSTFTVNAEQVMSGMIQAGDRVDIAVNWKEVGTSKPKTKQVLECIEIFALDKQRAADETTTTAKGTKIETLSVLVKPDQAQTLQMAKELGRLSLTLRTPGDTTPSGLSMLTEEDFEATDASQGVVSKESDEGGKLHELPEEPAPPAEPVVEPSRPSPLPNLQDVATEQPAPVWVMEIFEGETVRRLEIPLSNNTSAQTTTPVPTATPAAAPTPPSA